MGVGRIGLTWILLSLCWSQWATAGGEVFACLAERFVYQDQLTTGGQYWIQMGRSSALRRVEFQGYRVTHRGKVYLFFEKDIAHRDLMLEVPFGELSQVKEVDGAPGRGSSTALSQKYLQEARRMLDWVLVPRPVQAETLGIKVVGDAGPESKEISKNLVQLLGGYDSYLGRMGLKLPQSTRIILDEAPSRLENVGPVASKYPVFYLWDSKSHSTVALYPANLAAGPKSTLTASVLKVPSVVLHERAHLVLQNTFSADAVVIANPALNEAACDFLTALYSGSPKIGEIGKNTVNYLRDISSATITKGRNSGKLASVLDLGDEHHFDSLVISNLLWRLRNVLGQERSRDLIQGWLLSMNQYYKSYRDFSLSEGARARLLSHGSSRQEAVNLLEFVASVIDKEAQSGLESQLTTRTLYAYFEELNLDPARIAKIKAILVKQNRNFDFDPELLAGVAMDQYSGALLYLLGGGAAVAGASRAVEYLNGQGTTIKN